MMTEEQFESFRVRTIQYLEKAGIPITEEEKHQIEIFEFGLNVPDKLGLQLLVYVNTPKVCAKELVLFPNQTCPEHIHPTIGNVPGKEETFRCKWGKVFLYVPGPKTAKIQAAVPEGMEPYFTVFHEIELNPGEQYTLVPDTIHWFQAGSEGAVISEFSTTNTDDLDRFTDPRIQRLTEIA